MTEHDPVASRVRELLVQILNVPAARVGSELSAASTPEWTSLNHLMLVSQIEAEFGVYFSSAEVPTLSSFDEIVQAVRRHKNAGS